MKTRKSDVWFLVKQAFPGYSGRTFQVSIAGAVVFHDTNWGGGTRNRYIAVPLAHDGKPNYLPDFAPWSNPVEGKTVSIPAGWTIVEHTVFCGHDMGITVHVGTGDMAKVLPNGIPA